MIHHKEIAILGAGPSGLMTAFLLSKYNYKVTVFEASGQVGGLAQSIILWGKEVEFGPHFIEYNATEYTKELIDSLFDKSELIFFDKEASILTENGKKFIYPPNISNLLKTLSIFELLKAAISFFYAKFNFYKPKNAKDYLISNLGKYFYNHFFKQYSNKLWGLESDELDISYAIHLLPFRNFKGILAKIFLQKQEKIEYVYFKNGISELWSRLYEKCIEQNVSFTFNFKVENCVYENDFFRFITFDKQVGNSHSLISTLPFRINKTMFGKPLKNVFRFRNIILVYFKLESKNIFKQQCLYLYSSKIKAVRATNFSQFNVINPSENIVLLEYWEGDFGLWEKDSELITKLAIQDLEVLFPNLEILDVYVKKISKTYLIPEIGINEKMSEENNLSFKIPFYAIGRNNTSQFNYGIDTAIKESILFTNKFKII